MTDPAATPPRPRLFTPNFPFQQMSVIPHETTPPPRPRSIPGRGRGRVGDPAATPPPTKYFTASTCRKCGHVILAGQILGLRLDLEPTMLNDLTEYQALRDGIPTYDLWPDRIARRRHLEQIKWPEQTPRHAQHTCGTKYGTDPRPNPPATARPNPHGPPPF